MKKPTIHLYTICWNEEAMLGFFFRHYDRFVDKYIFFDDGSDDKTLDILSGHPNVETRPMPRLDVDSYVLASQNIFNNCWKDSRGKADWVIITAVDEYLYHPAFLDYLTKCDKAGITAIPTLGYQMLSNNFPPKGIHLIEEIQSGAPWNRMNRLSLFKPDALKETNYGFGQHRAHPEGIVIYPSKDELMNLHYKYLSLEHTFKRHKELEKKLGSVDKKNKWGHRYSMDKAGLLKDWKYFESIMVDNIIQNPNIANESHSKNEERWWRKKD